MLAQSSKVIVSDLYDPIHLETLAFTKDLDGEFRTYAVRKAVEAVNAQLKPQISLFVLANDSVIFI